MYDDNDAEKAKQRRQWPFLIARLVGCFFRSQPHSNSQPLVESRKLTKEEINNNDNMFSRISILMPLLLAGISNGLALYSPKGSSVDRPSQRQVECVLASPQLSTSSAAPPSFSLPSRRAFLDAALATRASTFFLFAAPGPARAGIPTVTLDEFYIIVRDSGRSISRVEFSGPKSETVQVKLADGTSFGIRDIKESPTDPRSPLKIAAVCRENGIPTKFVDFEAVLASKTTKRKMYTNQRVQEAAAKEKERLERMQRDEKERLAELAKMGQDETNK